MKKIFSGLMSAVALFGACLLNCGVHASSGEYYPYSVFPGMTYATIDFNALISGDLDDSHDSDSDDSSDGDVDLPVVAPLSETVPPATSVGDARDTELVFIMDESGSMEPARKSTIKNFNRVINEQRNLPNCGKIFVTTVMFNGGMRKVHDRVNIRAIAPITRANYCPSGLTALRDTVVTTLQDLSKQMATQRDMADHRVIVVIMTDGKDTASHRTPNDMKSFIQEMKNAGWQFAFFGANIDAASEAEASGIGAGNSFQFSTDGDDNVETAFTTMSTLISNSIIGSEPLNRSAVNPPSSVDDSGKVNPAKSSTVKPANVPADSHSSSVAGDRAVNPPGDFVVTNPSRVVPVRAFPRPFGRSWGTNPFVDDDDDMFQIKVPDTK